MLIIDENAKDFALTETLGGKLIRLSLPSMAGIPVADNYGLQLAATLLSDERTVACGDQASGELLTLARRVAQTDVTVFINGPTGTGKEVLPNSSIIIQSVKPHHSWLSTAPPFRTTCWRRSCSAMKRCFHGCLDSQ